MFFKKILTLFFTLFLFSIHLYAESPPTITSNGGGDTASINITENSTLVTTIQAESDFDITYSITGGADSTLFTIDNNTGELNFIAPPDYENPTDADSNNQYEVEVKAEDDQKPAQSDTQEITISITNLHANLSIQNFSIAEDSPHSYAITAELDNNVEASFTVDINTSDGTATLADNDYTKATGTVTFMGYGYESQTIQFQPTTDSKYEPNESVNLILSNCSSNDVTLVNGAVITITNDDADTAPPILSHGSPSGNQGDITEATLHVSTNENATCKYSPKPNIPYDNMDFTFSTTGGVGHATTVSNLTGDVQHFYVRCSDDTGNKNSDDYEITFLTDTTPPTTPSSAPDLVASSDTGASDTDNITYDKTPTFSLHCSEVKSTLTLYIKKGEYGATIPIETLNCTAIGDVEITIEETLSSGVYTIYYTETDRSNNSSGNSPSLNIEIKNNQTPTITSASTVSISENSTAITTVTATDDEPISYSIVGGADVTLFNIDTVTGKLTFKTAPEYDANGDNQYEVQVKAEDNQSPALFVTQDITVTVKSQRPFIMTIKTDNSGTSQNNQFILPVDLLNPDEYKSNFIVDWGDGTTENIITSTSGNDNFVHTYTTAGTYTISIIGEFPHILFRTAGSITDFEEEIDDEGNPIWVEVSNTLFAPQDSYKILTVEQWGDIHWKSMDYSFADCSNLQITATDAPNLSEVTDMSYMFKDATTFNSDISHWDVSNVKDMTGMFDRTTSFNQPIGNWDVSNVKDMRGMFEYATSFNQPIGNWNVSDVTDMSYMFYYAESFNQPIEDWNVSTVTDMGYMFENATSFNQPIGNWNVSKVTDMQYMFNDVTSFSSENYDNLLMNWSQLNLQNSVYFEGTTYCLGENAKNKLIDDFRWHITDKGKDCSNYHSTSLMFLKTNFELYIKEKQKVGIIPIAKLAEQTIIYSIIEGEDGQLFSIDANSGELTFNQMPDYRTTTEYRVNIKIEDDNDPSLYKTETIIIQTFDSRPTIVNTDFKIYEGDKKRVGIIPITKSPEQTITYSIVEGEDAQLFSIDANSGELTFHQMPNYSNPTEYRVTIKVEDSDNPSLYTIETITIHTINPFMFTISTPNDFTIPTHGDGYDYNIDWGDGTTSTHVTGNKTHSYTREGEYTIRILGEFPQIYFKESEDRKKILIIQRWGGIQWHSMEFAFYGCSNLKILAEDTPDLSKVTDMSSMFWGARAFNQPIGNWDVSNVTNMNSMFLGATAFNQPIGNWDISSVTRMGSMFRYANSFNQPIGNWDVSHITYMDSMFNWAGSFNQPIGNWDVSNVTNMDSMFFGARAFNQPIGNWNVSKVTDMQYMFNDATSFNQPIGEWNVSHVTDMHNMFEYVTSFNQPIGEWNVSHVTDMQYMFNDATSFNQPIGNWNVSHVTDMHNMFEDAIAFNQSIGDWDVSKVTDMRKIFNGATSFSRENYDNLLIHWSQLNLHNSVHFSGRYYCAGEEGRNRLINDFHWTIEDKGKYCSNYQPSIRSSIFTIDENTKAVGTIAVEKEPSQVIHYSLVGGADASLFTIDSSTGVLIFNHTPDYETPIDANNDNHYEVKIKVEDSRNSALCTTQEITIVVNNLSNEQNTTFVITIKTDNSGSSENNQFTLPTHGSEYNYTIDWGDDTIDVNLTKDKTHTYSTAGTYTIRIVGKFPQIYFNNQGDKEKILTVEQWGTNSWRSMESAFSGCSNLQITATDTPNLLLVTNMNYMFYKAINFNQPIGNWDVSKVTHMNSMFKNATAFNQAIGNWDVSKVTDMRYMFENATAFNQPIGNWNISNVRYMYTMFSGATVFNQPIGNWNVSNVIDMQYMFNDATSFNQPIGNWNVSKVTDMSYMFENATSFSIENYDELLINWSQQELHNDYFFNFTGRSYCAGERGRDRLINHFHWIITDEGKECSNYKPTIANYNLKLYERDKKRVGIIPIVKLLEQTVIYSIVEGEDEQLFSIDATSGELTFNEMPNYNTSTEYKVNIKVEDKANPSLYSIQTITIETQVNIDAFVFTISTQNDFTIPTYGGGYDYNVSWGDGTTSTHATENITHTYARSGDYTISITGKFPQIYFNRNADSDKILSINWWGTNKWRSMNSAFAGCRKLKILAHDTPDLSEVTDMSSMFRNARSINEPVGDWDVSNVENMSNMFDYATSFNQPIGNWNIAHVTDMSNFLTNAKSFSTENYDALLQHWSQLSLQAGVTFTGVYYCKGEEARTSIIENHHWNIDDKGGSCLVLKIKTDNRGSSEDNQFTVISKRGGYYYVDWGDGSTDKNAIGGITHSYTSIGIYTIRIEGRYPHISFSDQVDKEKILEIKNWGNVRWHSMERAFAGYSNLQITATDAPDLSSVTSMQGMFQNATAFNSNINHWDVSHVTDMSFMFDGAKAFNQTLRDWDVSRVKNMDSMFTGATSFSNRNYDELLMKWSQLSLRYRIKFGGRNYCAGEEGRDRLINYFHWIIIDEGKDCSNYKPVITNANFKLYIRDKKRVGIIPILKSSEQTVIYSIIEGEDAQMFSINAESGELTFNQMPDYSNPTEYTITIKVENRNNPSLFSTQIITIQTLPNVNAFVFTVSTNNTFTIPTYGDGYDYTVSWGDETIDTHVRGDKTHSYAKAGIYTISITGKFPQIYFYHNADSDKIKSIDWWGYNKWRSMNHAFHGCRALKILAHDTPDLSEVTDMSYMFTNARSINEPIGDWDVSNIENMSNMFLFAITFNQPIENWNVSNIENMSHMFEGATAFDQPIGDWNVSNVRDMNFMFRNATSFSILNYDNLLINWSQLNLHRNIYFEGRNYCLGEDARNILIDNFNWNIDDGNKDCSNYSVLITSSAFTISENSAEVGSIQVQKLPSQRIRYSLIGGIDSSKFRINSTTGKLTFKTAPDYETPTDSNHDNQYDIVLKATVVGDTTINITKKITVTVTDITEHQLLITSSTFTIRENSTEVGSIQVQKLPSQRIRYRIIGGDDGTKFTLSSSTGKLTFKTAPDYENPTDSNHDNQYDIIVKVKILTTGKETMKSISITVTNVDEIERAEDTYREEPPIGDYQRYNTQQGIGHRLGFAQGGDHALQGVDTDLSEGGVQLSYQYLGQDLGECVDVTYQALLEVTQLGEFSSGFKREGTNCEGQEDDPSFEGGDDAEVNGDMQGTSDEERLEHGGSEVVIHLGIKLGNNPLIMRRQ